MLKYIYITIPVDDISSDLSLRSILVQSIHGDRDQADREQALLDLKSGDVNILIGMFLSLRNTKFF